jgi:hypothetical protein
MNRCLAFLLALVFATLSVSSACVAATGDWVHFTLEPERSGGGKIHATFRDGGGPHYDNNWSTEFLPSELIGFDSTSFRSSGARPVHFALVREAGRLDCSGNGGNAYATGNCSFTPDPGFGQLLINRGIGRPSREQAFALMAVNARREVIDAVASAHYPTPTIDNLMALSALGVTGPYISGIAAAGYRPRSIDTLIAFKALTITPDWIGSFVRIGYGNVPADELVQLKALNITPEFIMGFERIGYRHLPVDTLVQLKAMDVTPEFVRAVQQGDALPAPDRLVQLRALGRELRSH